LLEFYKGKIKGYEIVEGAQPGPDGKMGTSDDIAKIENIDNEQESKRSYRDKKTPKPVDMNPAKAFKETKTAFNTAISSGNWGDIVKDLVINKKTIESSELKGNILTLNYKLALKTADGQSWYPTGDMKIDISNMTELRKLSELYVDKRFTHKNTKAKRDDIVRELMKVFKNASKNNENATGVFGRSSGQNKMGPINEKGKYNKP